MTEPTPAPGPAADPTCKVVIRTRWRRVATYCGAIAVVLALWICGLLYIIRYHPDRFLDRLLAELPFPSSHGEVFWQNRRTLEIKDLKLGAFFYADAIIVTASPIGLLQRHVAKIQIKGGQLYTSPLADVMEQTSLAGGASEGLDWTIGRLEINRGTVLLQDLVPDMPPVPVRLGVGTPLTLNHIHLAKPDASPDMQRVQRVEIENVNIISPYDPLSRVLAFPLIRVRFTYAELWQHHVRDVSFVRPVIFLGQDLFWFTEAFTKHTDAEPTKGVTAPWFLSHFEVEYGQLALNAFGQPALTLPFFFKTQVNDIRSDDLGKISAKSSIPIIRFDQDYPDYKLDIVNLHGNLNISVPPSAKANNVVPTIFVDTLAWNKIPATEVWTSVDFDPSGCYAELGGKCEGGYIKGNLEIYYTKGLTWNINLFAQKINIQPVTRELAGKYVDLTGELDGKLSVQGKATEITDCHGSLSLPKPGLLKIKSMEDLLSKLPGQLALQDQAMKLMVQSFQTYPYQNGLLKVEYKPEGGVGSLRLNSPDGGREFNVYWHPWQDTKSSKVAKDADNR